MSVLGEKGWMSQVGVSVAWGMRMIYSDIRVSEMFSLCGIIAFTLAHGFVLAIALLRVGRPFFGFLVDELILLWNAWKNKASSFPQFGSFSFFHCSELHDYLISKP